MKLREIWVLFYPAAALGRIGSFCPYGAGLRVGQKRLKRHEVPIIRQSFKLLENRLRFKSHKGSNPFPSAKTKGAFMALFVLVMQIK